jgi:Polysaccharide lyase
MVDDRSPADRIGRRCGPMWSADVEHSMSLEWTSLAAGLACEVVPLEGLTDRVQRVTGPVAQGRYAYRFEIRDGDSCSGPRAELANSLPDHLMYPGQERWISMQAYFPSNYLLYGAANYRTGLVQLKQVGISGQYPAVSVSNGSGYLCIYLDSRSNSVSDSPLRRGLLRPGATGQKPLDTADLSYLLRGGPQGIRGSMRATYAMSGATDGSPSCDMFRRCRRMGQ